MKLSLGNLLPHCPSRKYATEIRKKKKSNSSPRFIYNYFLNFYFIWYGYWNPRQFSLPEFVAEVQDVIQPVLKAYFKVSVMHSHSWDPSFWYKRDWLILSSSTVQGDHEVLSEHCSPEMIERCKAERTVLGSQGIFFDNKVREPKIIISASWIWTLLCWFSAQILCLLLKKSEDVFLSSPFPWVRGYTFK